MKTLILATSATFILAACTSVGADHAGDVHMHGHAHGADCGHTAVAHNGDMDYLHDGHMHHAHDGHYDEHVIMVSADNPNEHNPVPTTEHDGHMHTMEGDDHAAVPHGEHMDFLHDGHLHHLHGDHMDEHGTVEG